MECTQRLECTQDLNETQRKRESEEQVGFLGISGKVFPIMRGPNKIGRDPRTCSIAINLNSVSRQHAVINILSNKKFMIMDLDSANKTKLMDKSLVPYIPYTLNNGDTVQFGDVFGIFRLLEDDDDDFLPVTQALDVPDTPILSKHASNLNKATTIPESPDVSDRDDSFIIPSQPMDKKIKSSGCHNFIKPSTKIISIQPIGCNKIDNIYWNSSKKSTSLSLNDSSLNNSLLTAKSDHLNQNKDNDINEMETQPPVSIDKERVDSIYSDETQIPGEMHKSPSIYSLETQLPIPTTEHLPQVQKINDQHEMQFSLFTANKENINNAETQIYPGEDTSFSLKKISVTDTDTSKMSKSSKSKSNVSDDDELLFDDVDDRSLEENIDSQAILPQELPPIFGDEKKTSQIEPKKRVIRLKSDSSTDCEDIDILPTQQIPPLKKVDIDDDVTDCEDDFIELKIDEPKSKNIIALEDMETQIIGNQSVDVNFEDLPTQVIAVEEPSFKKPLKDSAANNEPDIEDMCTQIIPKNAEVIEIQPEQFSPDIVGPFKVPQQSPRKSKKTPKRVIPTLIETANNNEENFYANTQDLCADLDSQPEFSPEIIGKIHLKPVNVLNENTLLESPNHLCKSSSGGKFPHQDNKLSAKKSSGSSESEERVNKFVSNLSSQQIRDVIGVAPVKKMLSDGSDVDVTPKKVRPFKLMTMDLPNSQEIKTSVTLPSKSLITDSSSDSETEMNSEDQCTPILFRNNKKPKVDVKLDLSKKFEIDTLPSRIITRRRKPTEKVKLAVENKGLNKNTLKPKYLAEQDDNIDSDIITENISRLKNIYEKSKHDKNGLEDKSETSNIDKIQPKNETNKKDMSAKKEMARKIHNNDKESKTLDKLKNPKQIIDSDKDTIKVEKEIANKKDTRRGRPKKDAYTDKIIDTYTEATIDLTKTKRTTRSRNKKTEIKPVSPEKEILKPSEKRKRNKKNEEKEHSEIDDSEVRRSKRQRVAHEKKQKEIIKVKIKSILKKSNTHEQSTVYNISSASSSDSPRSLKRSAVAMSGPSAKRSKAVSASNASLRVSPANQGITHYVLFTAFPCDEVKKKLEKLGAIIVSDVTKCTVVLTLQIKRTFKLLCAVGLGRPIVGPNWVQACADSNMIVDPWAYLIKDEVVEKRFHFSLERILSGQRNFLSGYNVSSTPSVLPNSSEMELIVQCSGGKWKEEGPRWVCVSSAADKHLWPSLRRRGATIVTTEFILGGVLKQELNIERNKF